MGVHNCYQEMCFSFVFLHFAAIPDPFLRVPQTHSALAGSNTSLTCETKPGAGTVRWVKGHHQPSDAAAVIRDRAGRYEIRRPSAGVSELHIYGVEFADEDVYRCYVGFIFQAPDLNYAKATLTVQCKL